MDRIHDLLGRESASRDLGRAFIDRRSLLSLFIAFALGNGVNGIVRLLRLRLSNGAQS